MALTEEMQLLKAIPLFAEIEESKLKLIAFASQRLRYSPGEIAIREGELTDSIYVILSGRAEVVINAARGPIAVATIGKNAIFGEIGVLCDLPRTATVRAYSELQVLRIEKSFFLQILEDFPTVARAIMNQLGLRLARALKFISAVPRDQAEAIMQAINIDLVGHSGRIDEGETN